MRPGLPLLLLAPLAGCAAQAVPSETIDGAATRDLARAGDLAAGGGLGDGAGAADGAVGELDLAVAAADLALPPGSPDLAQGAAADLAASPRDLAEPPADLGCPGPKIKVGTVCTVQVDDYTGDQATTQPKGDANDGKSGDNPYFRRTNVAYAHSIGGGKYWYTSKHQNPGDPDPRGPQFVDYRPPLATLAAGRYQITAEYRQSDNRAPYDAVYTISHRGGAATVKRDQRLGLDFVTFDLGIYDLGCTGSVRVTDTGADSISFGRLFFKYLGP